MINIRTLKNLKQSDGLTLKNGKKVNYKTGYQVATEGTQHTNPEEAMKAIKAYKGDCGIWYEDGIYYIDKSHREATKQKALQVGKDNNQISIFKWKDKSLIYC